MSSPATAPLHVGWFRPQRGRWRAICEAKDHGSAMALLLASDQIGSGELVVLVKGEHPNGGKTPAGQQDAREVNGEP
ncbi:hypothetical protein AYO44_03780 [Planctomycetaceae bacterium SCGC AG-212-F19]|nr:hypothetical protein AYO44_03780 [Planctomycetaceae bacterium SCGC AG-212-F19]